MFNSLKVFVTSIYLYAAAKDFIREALAIEILKIALTPFTDIGAAFNLKLKEGKRK
ncbi:hypothetical protein R3X25_10095 [Lutibacter sp. TH_r2]|uniref:hypothetical protein n=1 Tax=Lutibacter sp. TH_r2 TaxID=3082083 RepID=UPI0029551E39|nr:hypothetical protein [Lutibacter sp. TH_r2]MDV7187631.1 hypothetical protein [Lutibacter sp. TH_r2]